MFTPMFTVLRVALNKAAQNPFRTYFRLGSLGFGGTFLSNLAWTSQDNDAPLSLRENPEMYAGCLLAKSAYAGFLWPAIPFRIQKNPRRFFCVGAGFQEKAYEAFNGEVTLNNIEDYDALFKDKSGTGGMRKFIREGVKNGRFKIRINGKDAREEFLKSEKSKN